MIVKPAIKNTRIPFPQANDVYKVIKYVDTLVDGYHQKSLDHITLEMVPRQISYYKAAAKFLDLMDDKGPTEISYFLFRCDRRLLFSGMVKQILDHKVFYDKYLGKDKEGLIQDLIQYYAMNETTAIRRYSTLSKWVAWCDIIIRENQLEVIEYGH